MRIDCLIQERQRVCPCITGFRIDLCGCALAVEITGKSLYPEADIAHRQRPIWHHDQVPRSRIFDVPGWGRVPAGLETTQRYVGQIRRRPHLVIGARDKESSRLLDRNCRRLDRLRVTPTAT
jgi:hypothetical protein